MDARPLPGNPASAVYGTILVAGQLAVESSTHHSTGQILGSLAATLIVFWLAHAYTDTLGGTISGGTDERPSLVHALREEWPIVESGLIPGVLLALVVIFGGSTRHATTTALVVTAVELVGWAVLAGRRAGARGARLVAYALVAAVLGAALVVLKSLIH